MIKGINGAPYIDLDQFIDVKGFQDLHPEICKGFALAREYAKEGTWITPGMDLKDSSYILNWKPIYQAFNEYQQLPEDHPIKIHGREIFPTNFKDYKQRNVFTRYLKSVLDAYDPYIYYFLWDEGDWNHRGDLKNKTEESKFFPGVVNWIEELVNNNVFSQIGRVIFFLCDHDGVPFEHRDLQAQNGVLNSNQYTSHKNEFIHIRSRTKRGFYIWDPENKDKVYVNSHCAFWNDQDWHGGESVKTQEYGMRVDGVFTEDFPKETRNKSLGQLLMQNKIEASWEDEYQSFDWKETFVIDEIPLNDLWKGKSTDLRLALDRFHRENGVVKECTKHYMAFEPMLPDSFNSVFSAFKDKTYSYNFLKLTGSYNIPIHYDSYSTFTKKFNVDEDKINKIKRTVVMITPWSSGQTLQIGNDVYSHWDKGNCYTWEGQEWHGAGNFGFKDLVVMQVTWV